MFGLVTVKGSELEDSDPLKKVKGSLVLGGDTITTNVYEQDAIFSGSSSSPAAMTAYRTAVLLGNRPKYVVQQAVAEQAYIQAELTGPATFVVLPLELHTEAE